ncbi:uncharacterized protein B0I36DRAFT_126819 [Microdochium trichocladiopsis]|uniref:Uncharacterized protein n=1 Tax=Microdochium trichocladiopsis TaxID=1682393 RepID=A0A9P8Y384_9PEZI|nr:uncharacterized protein B0I36DRAFT_126819 [Microdochium trichocladiopsis]KAH7028876.1 hypothetical protein B0I36DRAFT_126819 [Microdochium trichocladiopsis]
MPARPPAISEPRSVTSHVSRTNAQLLNVASGGHQQMPRTRHWAMCSLCQIDFRQLKREEPQAISTVSPPYRLRTTFTARAFVAWGQLDPLWFVTEIPPRTGWLVLDPVPTPPRTTGTLRGENAVRPSVVFISRHRHVRRDTFTLQNLICLVKEVFVAHSTPKVWAWP